MLQEGKYCANGSPPCSDTTREKNKKIIISMTYVLRHLLYYSM